MPLIVDKEEIRLKIITAFQECIYEKPLAAISMRDIASKADMSHQKMLYYFKNKEELIYSYIRYSKDFISEKCIQWFDENIQKKTESNKEYLNRFLLYVSGGKENERRPNATVQIYVLAQYNSEIAQMVKEMFFTWKSTMEKCLIDIYGDCVGKKEAEAMMIIVSGTFMCNYNKVLTGAINRHIIDCVVTLNDSPKVKKRK
ncbi:MAG: TetR/AcrR family transcriptional regulator [Spirochaetota bacterium]